MARGPERTEALISFISKLLAESRDAVDSITLAKLAADLAEIQAIPLHIPEPLHTEEASEPVAAVKVERHSPVNRDDPKPLHTPTPPQIPLHNPEDEILDLVGDMREVALRFRGTLAKDVAKLETTRTLQEEQISSVAREQKKSVELRSSGKIGFFCTLLLLAISALLLAALVPFIIVTR